MFSNLWEWLFDHYPGVLITLAIVVVAVIICYKIVKFYYTKFKKVEDICDKVETIPDIVNRNTENIEKQVIPKLNSISNSLSIITSILFKKGIVDKTELFTTTSPVNLTDIGVEVLELIGGKQYIDANSERLIEQMKVQNYKSALDVQNQSNLLILEQAEADDFVPIKDFIYQNPQYKAIVLDMSTVVTVMGIYLRDKYFEKYPVLKHTE
ncbi:hypothetical protein ES705_43741 [subsurface metagenome]